MHQTLDDIVFENRDKSYGAYLLRTLYEKHLFTGLFIAGSLFIVALVVPLVINNIFPKTEVRMQMTTVEVLPPVESIDPNMPPPPAMPKIEEPVIEQTKFVPVEITKEDIQQEKIATQEELEKSTPSTETIKGDTTAIQTPPIENVAGDPTGTSNEPFMNVSRGAEAGYDADAFLRKNTIYPASERVAGNEATIHVTFKVTAEGKITEVVSLKGFSKVFEDEAIRVVKSMPDWKPAMQNGHPIAVRRKIKIHFKLDEFDE
jgi:periplasmic protein TonB